MTTHYGRECYELETEELLCFGAFSIDCKLRVELEREAYIPASWVGPAEGGGATIESTTILELWACDDSGERTALELAKLPQWLRDGLARSAYDYAQRLCRQ